ncbi:hypothetical protein DFJ73DRAFT_81777 [Zopfochytrium polystomum]|nr:hypothetical protein DFJ73DRAFT_81777 [Zopfochytrium polystomum]
MRQTSNRISSFFMPSVLYALGAAAIICFPVLLRVQAIRVYVKPAFATTTAQEQAAISGLLQTFSNQSGISVSIDYAQAATAGEYLADLSSRVNGNESIYDVYMIKQSWGSSFPSAFADLFKVAPEINWQNQLSLMRSELTSLDLAGSALIAVPYWADFGGLFFRKDILTKYNIKAPALWADIQSACETIRSNEPDLYCFATAFSDQELIDSAAEWLASATNTPLIASGGVFNFQDPGFASILTVIRNWTQSGVISKDVLGLTEPQVYQLWIQGKVVFFQSRVSQFFQTLQSQQLTKDNFAILKIPGLSGTLTASTVGGFHLAVNSKSKDQNSAAKVVQFMTSFDFQRNRTSAVGVLPSYTALYSDSAL